MNEPPSQKSSSNMWNKVAQGWHLHKHQVNCLLLASSMELVNWSLFVLTQVPRKLLVQLLIVLISEKERDKLAWKEARNRTNLKSLKSLFTSGFTKILPCCWGKMPTWSGSWSFATGGWSTSWPLICWARPQAWGCGSTNSARCWWSRSLPLTCW